MPAHDPGRGAPKRAPRNTLSRAAIVEAALELIDTAGLDAVTMPNVAGRLGVGTMSLYRHVNDKRDLVDAVAERVMGRIEVPDGVPDDWEGRVVGYLRALREAAAAHPALGRILADHGLTVWPVFAQLETVHGILIRAGFAPGDAVRAFYSLFTYVFGAVLWELPRVRRQPEEAYVSSWHSAIDALDPGDYPDLHALRRELATAASADQFEYGLGLLVASLRARASADHRPPSGPERGDDLG
ncbi:TetR/AcrR family transcriptional regulator [Paractinoplanes rhizophilus]|uniref:TetR/AcrR family transcriptional regulator n=1 Tax=Paractinoplanes rhizophilus TaxID=1416877 RepID=A0ABW2HS67_9ACTN